MGDMLSQAEIDALLGGGSTQEDAQPAGNDEAVSSANTDSDDNAASSVAGKQTLTDEEKDILGEIGNISMGTAATTLFQLLNQKVWITTPQVSELRWEELKNMYDRPCVGIRVGYKEGLVGSNILILKERDVKIIANLMMGGDGTGSEIDGELTELDLSAINEAMNQMVGSSSTSLSSMTKMKIDINTPESFILRFEDDKFLELLDVTDFKEDIIAISFKMEVGTLIDSQIMQMIPTKFALNMVDMLKNEFSYAPPADFDATPPNLNAQTPQAAPAAPEAAPNASAPLGYGQDDAQAQQMPPQPPYGYGAQAQQMPPQPPYGYGAQAQQMPPQPPYGYPGQQMAPNQMPMPPYGYDPNMPMYQMPYMPPQPQQNVNVQQAQFQNFDFAGVMQQKENIGIIMDVPLEVNVELGRTSRLIREILEFGPGTVIELDKLAGEPIDIYVNGKHVAKGEVVVIDENFGVRITDIVSVEHRI